MGTIDVESSQVGDKYFTTKLTMGPAGDPLTLDFARTLLVKEQRGKAVLRSF